MFGFYFYEFIFAAIIFFVFIVLPVYFYKKRLSLMDSGYLKKLLFSFKGRATRLEFWTVSVVFYSYSVIIFVLFLPLTEVVSEGIFSLLIFLFLFFVFWFESAIHIKRWHDRDKSGWWMLIHLIPMIGFVWSVIDNGFLRGTEGNNRFGEDPLEISINNKEEITATTSDKKEITSSEEASPGETTSDKEEITSSEEASSDNGNDSPEDKLAKLSELKEKGLIDEDDYNSKKEEILKTI